VIGQFIDDGIGCKTCVEFVLSHWSGSIHLLLVKLSCFVRGPFVGFVYIAAKSFVRRWKWLTSVKRCLF